MKTDLCKCGGVKRKAYSQCRKCFLDYYKNRTTKACAGCKRELPLDNFRKRLKEDRPRSRCKECEASASKKWRQSNPEENKRRKKAWEEKYPERAKLGCDRRRWRKMGLNPDEVENYIKNHNGKCEICEKDLLPTTVDRDHKTGKFRGLLCSSCNLGLGYFYDTPILFDKAKLYLQTKSASALGANPDFN